MERAYDSKIEVAFSKEFFEKYKAEAANRWENQGEGFVFEVMAQMQDISIDKNYIGLVFLDKNSVYLSIRYSIQNDVWEFLADLCIKKFNKLKAILQGAS